MRSHQFVPETVNFQCQPPPVPPPVPGFIESAMYGALPDYDDEREDGSAYSGAVDEVWDDGPTFSGACPPTCC
jgi:hypothetical protein